MGINLTEPLKEFLLVGSDLPAKSLIVKMLFCLFLTALGTPSRKLCYKNLRIVL